MATVNIFEYASGGGFQGQTIPSDILCEGYGMLKTATEDFQAAGYIVRAFLDPRLKPLRSDLAAEVVEVHQESTLERTLSEMSISSDLSLIIAPETGGALSNIVRRVSRITASLNSTPDAIDAVSDKARLSETLRRKGMPTPETILLTIEGGFEEAARLYRWFAGPVVIKPVDGVGCESVSLAASLPQMKEAFTSLLRNGWSTRFIFQRFVEGLPVSVSLIADGEDARPVALNQQRISLNPPSLSSSYRGGVTPLVHSDAEAAFEVARRVVRLFAGLRGYVGVDMILSSDGPVVLEVNPRLTVSYVGLRRVVKNGLAEAMVRSAQGGGLPSSFKTEGFSAFSKFPQAAVGSVGDGVDVLCPPVRVCGEDLAETLLVSWGRTEAEALGKLPGREEIGRITMEASRN